MAISYESVTVTARAELKRALRSRDAAAIAALRSLLAVLDNAGAQPPSRSDAAATVSEHFAGAVAGLGATEAERRRLDPAEVAQLVEREVADRLEQAEQLERAGRDRESAWARYQAKLLSRLQGP
ncbi:MAG: hypothetical protein LBJ44_03645 [Propionibacteriaceae bacterium]|jgi:uncharacterized protein YqeY|nr:hypothetical protein [Propionibacteriaceae bacterium]